MKQNETYNFYFLTVPLRMICVNDLCSDWLFCMNTIQAFDVVKHGHAKRGAMPCYGGITKIDHEVLPQGGGLGTPRPV